MSVEQVVGMLAGGLRRLLFWLVPLIFVVLLGVISWQVISRYALQQPSTVTEELGRLLLMWLGVLGSALTWAEKKHVAVALLRGWLPERFHLVQDRLIYLCTSLFSVLLILGGIHLVRNAVQLTQTTPVLGLSMGVVYLVLPLGGVCFLLFSLAFFLEG